LISYEPKFPLTPTLSPWGEGKGEGSFEIGAWKLFKAWNLDDSGWKS